MVCNGFICPCSEEQLEVVLLIRMRFGTLQRSVDGIAKEDGDAVWGEEDELSPHKAVLANVGVANRIPVRNGGESSNFLQLLGDAVPGDAIFPRRANPPPRDWLVVSALGELLKLVVDGEFEQSVARGIF